jgi:putative redox protein
MENEMLARVVDPSRLRVEVTTPSGHPLVLDGGPPDGDDGGARPMEMVLAALAGCTAMDVASILRKKRQTAAGYEIAVGGERSETHPRVYTTIVIEHRVSGEVRPEAIRRSVELSATKYCPVSAMLAHGVSIEHRYRLADGPSVLVAITDRDGARVA